MRLFLIVLLTMLLPVSAKANDYFQGTELSNLRVFAVDQEKGTAWIRNKEGNEVEIYIGDRIGADLEEVIDIDVGSITVQLGDTNTMIPLIISNHEAEMNASEIDTSLVP